MESHDDPEARIRDLERPLTDRARASELGTQPYEQPSYPPTQPYADPYPPPPPLVGPLPPMPPPAAGYGLPYPEPPRRSGYRGGWLIAAAVIVVGVTAAVAGIVSFASTVTDVVSVFEPADTPAAPSIDINVPGIDVPPMVPGIAAPSEPTVVSEGQQVSISGVSEQRTVICNGGSVSVSGVDNTVDIAGRCLALGVSGVRNTITIEAAGDIGVSGFDNKVTYRTGEPEVGQSGSGNSIEQG